MSLAEAARPAALSGNSPASPAAAADPLLALRACEDPSLTPRAGADRPQLRLRRVRPRDDLQCSMGDAAANSVMIGVGETYFAAFALALGTGETIAGLVATLPMLFGAMLQLVTPWCLQNARSYKRWVVACVSLQAVALLSMPIAAWLVGRAAAGWVFVAASLYWAGAQASGPAWNTWIEDIVPRRLRANFFACRARVSQACTLAGFVAGGIALEYGQASSRVLAAFGTIFVLGAGCRFMSAWFLSRQTEPSRGRYNARVFPLRDIFTRRRSSSGAPLVIYLFAMQTAVQISGPYFTPYMLAQQELSYVTFMLLIGAAYVGKVISLPLWGHVAHYAGARRLLWIGGTAIIPVAALWLAADLFTPWETTLVIPFASHEWPLHISATMIYLTCAQLFSGIVWAAYELATLLMFFEAIPRQDRPSMLTYYNFGNAAAQVAGGLIGATILQFGQESHMAYMALFGISSLARLCTVPLLRKAPEPEPQVEVLLAA
jgi:MFS family permease